jgi:hypothetical protein
VRFGFVGLHDREAAVDYRSESVHGLLPATNDKHY